MPQVFHQSTNTIARVSIFGAIFLIGGLLWVLSEINRSTYVTQAFVAKDQPVQFSHRHHVGDDGIDCRYCHSTVEETASAGMPTTKTCMNCHSQLFANSQYLEPVRESWRSGTPLRWTRVHDLPDFAYFDHSIHVNKGVGCSTCHGRVDLMPLMWQVSSLQMEWCLECHRNPEKFVRPKDKIFEMEWPAANFNQAVEGPKLVAEYKILKPDVMTSCSTCHR
jgi:hypothetical protein